MVIADTSVWVAFQRDPRSPSGRELDSLLADGEVAMVGPVLVEVLQGARSETEFMFFLSRLSPLNMLEVDQSTWLRAGELSFRLRREGVTLSFPDLLISSLSLQHGVPLFTLDQDFRRVPGLQLHEPPA